MSSFDFLTGRTGGWQYHASAFRHRKTRWLPFISKVAAWLYSWSPKEKELIIFGPSAGWSLPADFLERFERVVFVEPDPSARWLLRLRFPKVRAEFLNDSTLLPWFNDDNRWCEFLAAHPKAAVLFSNLLGQIKLISKQTGPAKEEQFFKGLAGRTWASYHDLLSSADPLLKQLPQTFDSKNGIESLAQNFFVDRASVTDHETLWLSQNTTTEVAVWELRPKQTHVIGFVKQSVR